MVSVKPIIVTTAKGLNSQEKRAGVRVVDKASSWVKRALYEVGENNGENLNNAVTAIGTAGVAPIFIVHNPLAKEDKKTKLYSAWRQPISAVLALAVLTPVNQAWNSYVNKAACYERIPGMDLSAEPLRDVLIKKARADYELDASAAKRDGSKLGVDKKEYINKKIEHYQDKARWAELKRLRGNDNIVIYDAAQPELMKQHAADKTKTVLTIDKLIKPDELSNAKSTVMKDLLIGDHKLLEKGLEGLENVDDFDKYIKKYEIKKVEDFCKKKAGKKILKALDIDIKTFKKLVEEQGQTLVEKQVIDALHEETKVKNMTSKLYRRMNLRANEQINKIESGNLANGAFENKKAAIKESILNQQIDKLKKAIGNQTAKLEAKPNNKSLEKSLNILKQALAKLESVDGNLDKIKDHGVNFTEVKRDIYCKKYMDTVTANSKEFLKKFKKYTGLAIALMVLPISCGLLNWVYPRFMEKFLPELASAKKDKAQGKEAK